MGWRFSNGKPIFSELLDMLFYLTELHKPIVNEVL
jgi:hypothetical protein